MSADKTRSEQLADALEALEATGWGGDCFALTDHSEEQARLAAAELRRIPALEAERDRLQKANDGQTRLNITLVMENKELIAERGQLRAEVEALRDYCENARHLARLVCDALNVPILHDAPAAIEALRADAERYRWLIGKGISGGFTVVQDEGHKMSRHTGPSLTQTIDAARKQQ